MTGTPRVGLATRGLFSERPGFTEAADQMEAEDLAALLNEYLAALETTTPRPKPGRVELNWTTRSRLPVLGHRLQGDPLSERIET